MGYSLLSTGFRHTLELMPTKQRTKVKRAAKFQQKSSPSLFDFEKVSDAIVHQAVQILGPLDAQRILICVGKGQTAAAGLSAAIKLIRDGARPQILLSFDPDDLTEDGRLFLKQAEVVRVPIRQWNPNLPISVYGEQDLILDALLGANTKGDPRYPLDQVIKSINDSRTPVLCLDVPSGLDPKSGKPGKPTVVGMVTLQISVPTKSLLNKNGALFVGKVVELA